MPNVSRQMAAYPKPSLSWARNLSSESLGKLETSNKQLKAYLASQMVTGNVASTSAGKDLYKISQNIILDTDTLDAFFEKLAEITSSSTTSMTSAKPAPITTPKMNLSSNNKGLPETRQYMDYSSGGELQKTIVQNPIQRSMDNVGHPQPINPNPAF